MVKIGLKNKIFIINYQEISKDILLKIKSDLTFDNPEYTTKVKRDLWIGKTPKYIKLYEEEPDKNRILLPIGYLEKLKTLLKSFELIDKRLVLPEIKYKSNINLRDYQIEPVNKLCKVNHGGIIAICGSGKTNMAIETFARIGQPTLWICHTTELLNQTKERMLKCLDIKSNEIGEIKGGKVKIGSKITLALIQTLNKINIADIQQNFGCIVLDEAHHLPANTFYDTIIRFDAKYKYYVTATPDREDGLTEILNRTLGEPVHKIQQEDMAKYTIIPKLEIIKTQFETRSTEYVEVMKDICKNNDRNKLIKDIVFQAYKDGRHILLLSDRVTHLEQIKTLIAEHIDDKHVKILNGTLKKKEREEIIEKCNNKEIKVLLATKLAREGLDITHLDCLVLATPKKAKGAVTQEVGRIMRVCEGKSSAIVYDLYDNKCGIVAQQMRYRITAYKELKMM